LPGHSITLIRKLSSTQLSSYGYNNLLTISIIIPKPPSNKDTLSLTSITNLEVQLSFTLLASLLIKAYPIALGQLKWLKEQKASFSHFSIDFTGNQCLLEINH
jgi:hypothetical protein